MSIRYVIRIKHKQQTTSNDCWYACAQMLLTWKYGGVKTKPSGHHTGKLHTGPLAHTLHADYMQSKHLKGVLNENGLKIITRLDLTDFHNVFTHSCEMGPSSLAEITARYCAISSRVWDTLS